MDDQIRKIKPRVRRLIVMRWLGCFRSDRHKRSQTLYVGVHHRLAWFAYPNPILKIDARSDLPGDEQSLDEESRFMGFSRSPSPGKAASIAVGMDNQSSEKPGDRKRSRRRKSFWQHKPGFYKF